MKRWKISVCFVCLVLISVIYKTPHTVLAKTAPDSWIISPDSTKVSVGGKVASNVYSISAKGNKKKLSVGNVTWKSGNKKIATVSKKGIVTGKKRGKVNIYGTYKYKNKAKMKAECSYWLTVCNKVTKVRITSSTCNMNVDDRVKFNAKATPSNAIQGVRWTSSNTNVATVDTYGYVNAISAGSTKITAVTKDYTKKKASVTINVKGSSTDEPDASSQPEASAEPIATPTAEPKPARTAPPIEGNIVHSGAYEQTVWTIDAAGVLNVEGEGNIAAEGNTAEWSVYPDEIKTAVVNISEATTLYGMFEDCTSLTSVDMSGIDFSTVKSVGNMFRNTGLVSMDLRSVDMSTVYDFSGIFAECASLENVHMGKLENVTSLRTAFWCDPKLTNIDLSQVDASHLSDMSCMCTCCESLISMDMGGWNTAELTRMYQSFWRCSSLKSINMSGWINTKLQDISESLYGCGSLTSVNLQGFNTSAVTDMSAMFYYCTSLENLDVTGFDTSKVTDFAELFSNCSSLTKLDVSDFDTSNAVDMKGMFEYCNKLTVIDVSHFETSKVGRMSAMFERCENVTNLDVGGFDTSSVNQFQNMFAFCSEIHSLDVSGFNTSNAMRMEYMFRHCSGLKVIDVSGFDTSNVKWFSMMFAGCSSVESLDLSHFDTSSGEDFDLVSGCDKLTYLDLSNFNISGARNVLVNVFEQDSVTTIKTPKMTGNHTMTLDGTWVDAQGKTYTSIGPQMNQSITLTRAWNPS